MAETSTTLEGVLERFLRRIIKEELAAIGAYKGTAELLTPQEIAERLKVPVSWIYEQSRQGNIPVRRIGRYVRFDLNEVMESRKEKG